MLSYLISPDYTIVYNVLDYSAVTVPVTFANKSIDIADEYTAFRSPIDKANWQSCKSPVIPRQSNCSELT